MRLMFIAGFLAFFGLFLGLGSCTIIDTGNVGVRTNMGQIDNQEVQAGLTWKLPMVTSIDHYNVREATLDLANLTPKAADNLSLNDLDVSILYEVNAAKVADVVIGFAGQSPWDDETNTFMPGRGIIHRQSRESIYSAVSEIDSLTIHKNRAKLAARIKEDLQKRLDTISPDTFNVTTVMIRNVTTDKSIERSIQKAVVAQKDLERKQVEEKIAEAQARITVTQAEGTAKANKVLNESLTPRLLQYQQNEVMGKFAASGKSSTVILPSNATPLVNVGN